MLNKVFRKNPVEFAEDVLVSARNVRQYSIAGFLIVMQMFVLISAPHIFTDMVQDMLFVYFLMVAFTFGVLDLADPLWKVSLENGIVQYVVFFVGGLFLFTKIGIGGGVATGDYSGFGTLSSLIIAQSFVVAISEELMFRGGLPAVFQKSGMAKTSAILVSNLAFAGFHGWAYDWQLAPMISAFVFGMLMAYFWYGGNLKDNRQVGFPLAACGLHGAWNVVVLSGPFAIMNLGGMI
jgi:membrane protease YdiL (CAAX protease family)